MRHNFRRFPLRAALTLSLSALSALFVLVLLLAGTPLDHVAFVVLLSLAFLAALQGRYDATVVAGQYLDLAAGNAVLKEWYDDQKVENLAYDDNPTLSMMPKKPKSTGKAIPIPIIYEVNAGRSNTFSNAQGNQAPGLLAEPLLTLRPDYDIATLANQAMEASQDEKGAFLEFAQLFVDLAIQGCALSQASALFRSGTGTIAQISAISAGGVITLTNPSDISQFGINQTLMSNQTDGGSPRAALGWVIARNVMAGTITVSATAMQGPAGAPTGWAANDFLLVQGDLNAKMLGFSAWLPLTAPSATDNFLGMNRSPDSRLYGLAYPGASQPIEEAIIDASMLVRREKGRPNYLVTNYGSRAALSKALGTRRVYVDVESDAGINFRALRIEGDGGTIDVLADRNCQAATGFLLQMGVWTLHSLGPVPKIFKYGDGLEMLRLANADASEVRVGCYSNVGCRAPGWNAQITFQV